MQRRFIAVSVLFGAGQRVASDVLDYLLQSDTRRNLVKRFGQVSRPMVFVMKIIKQPGAAHLIILSI